MQEFRVCEPQLCRRGRHGRIGKDPFAWAKAAWPDQTTVRWFGRF